jgi:hypothetical protein
MWDLMIIVVGFLSIECHHITHYRLGSHFDDQQLWSSNLTSKCDPNLSCVIWWHSIERKPTTIIIKSHIKMWSQPVMSCMMTLHRKKTSNYNATTHLLKGKWLEFLILIYWGVHIGNNLHWGKHISETCNKAYKILGL